MNQLKFRTLVISIAGVLAILIIVQAYWIRKTFFLEQQELYLSATQVLEEAVEHVEEDAFCFNFRAHTYFKPGEGLYLAKHKWANDTFMVTQKPDSIEMFNLFRFRNDSQFVNFKSMMFDFPVTADVELKFEYQMADSVISKSPNFNSNDNNYTIQNYLDKLHDNRKVVQMINTRLLDSLVKRDLVNKVIYMGGFGLGIKEVNADTFEYLKPNALATDVLNAAVVVPILEHRKTKQKYVVLLSLNNSTGMVMKSMWLMLITSGLIILILSGLFAYFIIITLRQKRYSEMKNDFINNMTHEFKTPVTNISLALENIVLNGANTSRYLEIISNESDHLKENVERILQIAALDKNELTLQNTLIDVHELITKAGESFEAQLNRLNGSIQYSLTAKRHELLADEFHMKNILYNLIDNAIKYCNHIPEIRVSTCNTENGIRISISDNGTGIEKNQVGDIFTRFYRVENKDIHNIKGFGLGLSYVKHIISLYKGTIEVISEQGKGSTFIIELNN